MAGFDINDILQQIVGKAAGDNDILDGLMSNPAKALENMTGIDIPDEQIDAIIEKMGGIEGLVKDFQQGGMNGVVQGAESAAVQDVSSNVLNGIIGGVGGSSEGASSDNGGNIVGEILGGLTGNGNESSGNVSEGGNGNVAGEVLQGLIGGGGNEKTASKEESAGDGNDAGGIVGDLLNSMLGK